MTAILKLAVRIGGDCKKIQIDDVDMDWHVSKLREVVASSANLQPDDFELTFCGRKLNDKATLTAAGVRPGVTIHILKRPVVETVRVRSEAEIQELVDAFGTIRKACLRTSAAKLGTPACMERLFTAVPALRDDPVAIAFLKDPEGLMHVLDFFKLKRVFMDHPALAEASPLIRSILIENLPPTSATTSTAPRDNLLSLEAFSDEDDMDDASQESDTAQGGDDFASIARFLLSEPRQGTGNTGESSSSSIITPQMLGQALSDALASTAGGQQRRPDQETSDNAPSQLRQMLAQMHELGLRDDVINMQALQACDMNVQEAINLVLSGAMFD